MYNHVRRVKAILPYKPPGTQAKYLRTSLDLDKLTILVGPNASGKTAVLESIGYMISGVLETVYSALSLSLTTTFRPRRFMPSPIGGVITLDESHEISNLYIELAHPLLFKTENIVRDIAYSVLDTKASILLREIEKDISYNTIKLEEIFRRPLMLSRREKVYNALIELITSIVGQDIDVAAGYSLRRPPVFRTQKEEIRFILRYWPIEIKVLYSLFEDSSSISKAFIIENIRGTIVIKRKDPVATRYPRVAVFHPGFIYWRGVFEGLYYAYVHEGLPNEKESIRLLRKYIEWIDGYELVHQVLHVRTINGRRIPVYDLSDGQRVAILMGLLYAISKSPVLFLIDTPEAFVHPDGLPVVTDFIARLVAEGNQAIVATQSIEFLEELLVKARQHGVIDYTSVQRITLTKDGIVRAKSKWSGEISLGSIEELGADLRR